MRVCEHFILFIFTEPGLFACVLVGPSVFACMCAQEHASAAHSKHSRVKAIIISPPAIITTSDSPLPAKLISPRQSVQPLSLESLPLSISTLTKALLWYLSSFSFLFVVSSVSDNSRKSQFSTLFFLRLYPPKRLLRFIEMCLYPESNSTCWTRSSSVDTEGEKKAGMEIGIVTGIVRESFGCLGSMLKAICTSFPLKSRRQRHGWWLHSCLSFYDLHVFKDSAE